MILILSYFDQKLGPNPFIILPNEIRNETQKQICQIMDTNTANGFFVFEDKNINSANFTFEIKSDWARGDSERLMFTCLIAKSIHDLKSFKRLFKKYVDEIKKSKSIYKGLYLNDSTKNDSEISVKQRELLDICKRCFEECENQEKKLKALNIYILGLNHVGKTSIIRHLNQEQFDPTIKPTVGKEIIRVIFDNTTMDILDIGEDKSIKEIWKEDPNPPEAIVFVVDYSAGEEHYRKSKNEFERIIEFFFGVNSEISLPKTTPVLILASKVDNIKNFESEFLEKLLNPKKYGLNYRTGYVSAKMEEGVYDNFRWIIHEFLNYL